MIQRLTTAGTKFTNIKDAVEYGISGINEGKWDDTSVPTDYLKALPLSSKEQIFLIRIYFQEIYPDTTSEYWNSIGDTEIVKMYRNLDFWYAFNTIPESDPNNPNALKPYPILLDDAPVSKWMNVYPFTAVQSGVCTVGAGKKGKLRVKQISRFPLASGKISKNLPAEEQYWRSVRKLEVIPLKLHGTWRGPLKGSGIFLELPKRTIVGVSSRHIELQCSGELPNENDSILSNWNTDFANSELQPVNLDKLKDLVSGKTGVLEETDSWAFIITHFPDDCGELMVIICTNCTPISQSKFSITDPLQNLLRIKQATKTYPPPHNITFIKKYGSLIGGISGCGISIILSIIVAFLPIKFKGGETIKTILCIILIFAACLIFGMYICPKWILPEPIKTPIRHITQPPEPLQPNEQIKIYLKMIYPDTDIFDYANEKSIIQYYNKLNYSYPIPFWTPPIEISKQTKAPYTDVDFLEVTAKWGEAPWGTLFDIVKGSGIALKLGKYIVGSTVTSIVKELAKTLENRWLVYTPLGGSQTYQFYSDFFEQEGKFIIELHNNASEIHHNYTKFFEIESGLWIDKECSSPFSKENKQHLMLPWKYQLWMLSENFRNKVSDCDSPIDQAIDEVYDRRDSMDDPKILTHLGKTLKFNSAILTAYSKVVHFDLIVPRKTHPYEPWKKFVHTNLFLFNPNGQTQEPLAKSWISPPIHSLDSIATCSHKIGLSVHKSSNSWASDILKLDQTSDPENEIYSNHKDG